MKDELIRVNELNSGTYPSLEPPFSVQERKRRNLGRNPPGRKELGVDSPGLAIFED